MPINPLIALQSQTPDLGQTIGNALTNANNFNTLRENRETSSLRKQTALTEADKARVQSLGITGSRILPMMEQNDFDGVRSELTTRRDQMMKLGLKDAAKDLDEGLMLLGQNPQLLYQRAGQMIQRASQFGDKSSGGEIGTYNPRDYTTDSWAEFVKSRDPSKLARYESSQSVEIGGVPHVFDRAKGGYFPANVLAGGASGGGPGAPKGKPVTADTVAANAEIIEGGKARGKAGAEAEAAFDKKVTQAGGMSGLIKEADLLLDDASGSMAGTASSWLKGAAGVSDKTTQANNQLKLVSGWMRSNVPRMEGPQGEKDIELYDQMAGMVGDSTIPIEDRRAAIKTLDRLNNQYRPKPKTDAEFNALPSGTIYIDPDDGKQYRKP